jgi:hydrogenase maturation protein HypF
MTENALDIKVYGLVQGVGFRPFIYNLATQLKLSGWALNRNDCVQIRIQGKQPLLDAFIEHLQQQAPPLSRIETVVAERAHLEHFTDFKILDSQSSSTEITRISPDVAVCQDCLADMQRQPNRINYPFVNCTNCGPRFSIIQDLPYDRGRTTMKTFTMCPQCQHEYDDITDRRFHAQPNACKICGPDYELAYQGQTIKGIENILEIVCKLIKDGQIVAIKGVGGFHLACDATNETAVRELRRRKNREGKPFAVMFGNLEMVKKYAEINATEEKILLSEKRPIVLLKKLSLRAQRSPFDFAQGDRVMVSEVEPCFASLAMTADGDATAGDWKCKHLAPSVTRGLGTLGIMLPYTPFHYLLFERLSIDAIVLTSGNLLDEPIVINNAEAFAKLSQVANALLVYNRDIHNRSDDSVVMVVNDKTRLLRRSRGWVPEPVTLNFDVEGIIAAGAELKNCFCVGKGKQAILSQHIGDLKKFETYKFYQEALDRFKRLFRVEPELIACDLHPDYLSTRFAKECGLKTIPVQHHHAHIASCMAEYGLDEQVIGISLDGIGLGDDDNIWGGEFLICNLNRFHRFSHFEYVPMPGGDKAAEEPWRMGVAYLYRTFGREFLENDLPFIRQLDPGKVELLLKAIDKGINCPQTSSVGRLFDAVAAIINLVTVSTFEAEAPIRLETIIEETMYRQRSACENKYGYYMKDTIIADDLIAEVVRDVQNNIPNGIIAAKFHNTIVAIIVDLAKRMRTESGINKVILSGGVFQNRYLLEKTETLLREKHFTVYGNTRVPANDGGICLGQIAVAAKRRDMGIPEHI